ncbi:nuclear transport factor 2 family protein [Variovorax sp. LjRoot84]|uniref:nuclear transport factor 2 family protein n=1 Tax=Variovorax sp. LjRoot84 TaxID=3342340 RepID=UPI003F50D601
MTVLEEKNVAVLRDGYLRWNDSRGDSAQHWMDLMAEDVHWCSLGAAAAGASYTQGCCSKSEVQRYFLELSRSWEMLDYTADEFVAQGDRVVMLGSCEWKHRGTGKTVKTPKADVIRMRDGKIVDFMEFYDTAAALAATT